MAGKKIVHLYFNEYQKDKFNRAMMKSEPITMNLTKKAFSEEPNTYLLLGAVNFNRVEKADKMNTGTRIKLSKDAIILNRKKVASGPDPSGEGIWGDIWRATKHIGKELYDNVVVPTGNVLVDAAKKVGRKGAAKLARTACAAATGAAVTAQPELAPYLPMGATVCEAIGSAVEGSGMCGCGADMPVKRGRGRPPKYAIQ